MIAPVSIPESIKCPVTPIGISFSIECLIASTPLM